MAPFILVDKKVSKSIFFSILLKCKLLHLFVVFINEGFKELSQDVTLIAVLNASDAIYWSSQ